LVPVHALTANAAAGGTPSCAAPSAGGDWRSYGHDDANSRSQPDEKSLNSSAAATLSPVWSLAVAPSPSTLGGVPSAGLNGTPVVADGCVFAGGSDGHIVALNADTGAQVWRTSQLGDPNAAGTGGLIVGSVTVVGGKVIALINQSGGPFAVALDERTGQQVWQSQPVSHYPGSYTNANPVVYTGTLIFGFSAPEGDPKGQGGFALLSTASGHIDIVTDTIPPADQDRGYAGGGIWTAPAVDPQSGYAYLGAGNPSSKQMEHRNTNAILKVDLNPGASYGQIVAAYKGNVDQYEASQLTQTPVCAASEGTALDEFPLDDPACGQLDLDFGAAPNLFQDGQGHELIGELQKSGYYHAAYTDTMERAWTAPIGGPCAFCNADSSAVVGNSIYAVGTPGGVLASMGTATGQLNWASPVADGVHYGSVSTADGVVYTLDSLGFLDAADAATGAPLLHRPVFADTKQPATNITSAGVAIARHTVYVEAGGSLVAYQPKGLALP
jgi:outer membrane protein assembly factor BamB